MGIRSKLERIERSLSSEKVYTPDELDEVKRLPDNTEILFDWGEVFREIQELRAKAQGRDRETLEEINHVRPTKVGEVKAFFGFLERIISEGRTPLSSPRLCLPLPKPTSS